MGSNFKASKEWFKQADYDLETADAMFKTGRYIYTVFMCHLCIEKALKGLYVKKFKKDPPKIHNLNYFCEKIKIKLKKDLQNFVDNLNDLSIPTRYPDELERLLGVRVDLLTIKAVKQKPELWKSIKEDVVYV